jgi:hypothetical protein
VTPSTATRQCWRRSSTTAFRRTDGPRLHKSARSRNVRYHQTGTKRLRHPVVGELELSYEVPGSRSEETLGLLASWIATPAT